MAYRGSYGMGMGLTPWVQRLIIANGVIFLFQATMPALTSMLAFVPAYSLLRPWTAISYMFAHGGFMHLFFNMLGLFFFGPPLEARFGSSWFIKYYIVCGLGGAALSFLFAFNSPIIGASGAVYGIMLAFAMNWPDQPIYIWGIFPIPAKILVLIMGVMSFYSMTGIAGGGGNIAHAAHFGGLVAGFAFLKLNKPGGLFSGMKKRAAQKRHLHVVRGEPEAVRRPAPGGTGRRPTPVEEVQLDELDKVLDKISTQGMASLTPDERRLLDDVSRRYRQN